MAGEGKKGLIDWLDLEELLLYCPVPLLVEGLILVSYCQLDQFYQIIGSETGDTPISHCHLKSSCNDGCQCF